MRSPQPCKSADAKNRAADLQRLAWSGRAEGRFPSAVSKAKVRARHASGQTSLLWFSGSSICLGRPPGSSLFVHARGILVDGAFLFLAIDGLKGAATVGPVQGQILGPAGVAAGEITEMHAHFPEPSLPPFLFMLIGNLSFCVK